MKTNIRVARPCDEYKKPIAAFMEKLQNDDNPFNLEYPEYYAATPDAALKSLLEASKPAAARNAEFRKSRPTYPYLLMDGAEMLGAFYLTPTGNQKEAIRAYGNIGYVVAPDFRRRGVASFAVLNGLALCRELFLMDEVIIGCYESNVGSMKTSVRAGGVEMFRIWRQSDAPLEKNGVWDIYFSLDTKGR